MIETKIQDLIDQLGADDYKKGESWNGYDVYIPEYEGDPVIGLPYVVLVKGNEARICDDDEALAYLRATVDDDDEDNIDQHAIFGGKKVDSPSPDWLS